MYKSSEPFCPSCRTDLREGEPLNRKAREIILSTTNEIQGKLVSEYLALVFGAGNAAWTIETTAGRANTALSKAEDQLRGTAAELGADAVIGITFSMDSSGSALNRSQAITLLGTAVKLKKSTGGV